MVIVSAAVDALQERNRQAQRGSLSKTCSASTWLIPCLSTLLPLRGSAPRAEAGNLVWVSLCSYLDARLDTSGALISAESSI
jgi:hypothetical protein